VIEATAVPVFRIARKTPSEARARRERSDRRVGQRNQDRDRRSPTFRALSSLSGHPDVIPEALEGHLPGKTLMTPESIVLLVSGRFRGAARRRSWPNQNYQSAKAGRGAAYGYVQAQPERLSSVPSFTLFQLRSTALRLTSPWNLRVAASPSYPQTNGVPIGTSRPAQRDLWMRVGTHLNQRLPDKLSEGWRSFDGNRAAIFGGNRGPGSQIPNLSGHFRASHDPADNERRRRST
jgi:hypothetical protein